MAVTPSYRQIAVGSTLCQNKNQITWRAILWASILPVWLAGSSWMFRT